MPGLRIEVDEKPSPELRESILQPLLRFNETFAGPTTLEPLALALRSEGDDAVVGGLWADIVYQWMFIHYVFVPEEFRGRGLGSQLIATAEEIAKRRGCVGIRLNTYSFQAPAFYPRLGYELLGKLSNHPPGHEAYLYFKHLTTSERSLAVS